MNLPDKNVTISLRIVHTFEPKESNKALKVSTTLLNAASQLVRLVIPAKNVRISPTTVHTVVPSDANNVPNAVMTPVTTVQMFAPTVVVNATNVSTRLLNTGIHAVRFVMPRKKSITSLKRISHESMFVIPVRNVSNFLRIVESPSALTQATTFAIAVLNGTTTLPWKISSNWFTIVFKGPKTVVVQVVKSIDFRKLIGSMKIPMIVSTATSMVKNISSVEFGTNGWNTLNASSGSLLRLSAIRASAFAGVGIGGSSIARASSSVSD